MFKAMERFFSEPIVVVVLVPSILAFIFYKLGKEKTGLVHELLSYHTLLTRRLILDKELTIHYGDEKVTDLSVSFFLLKNTGNKAIKKEDFDRPFKFILSKCRILGVATHNKNRKTITPILKHEGNEVIVEPMLLNPSDEFVIKVLAANEEGQITYTVDFRIVGVPFATNNENVVKKVRVSFIFIILSGIITTLLLKVFKAPEQWVNLNSALHVVAFMTAEIRSMVNDSKNSKRKRAYRQ
jgi:hypothetical protein